MDLGFLDPNSGKIVEKAGDSKDVQEAYA